MGESFMRAKALERLQYREITPEQSVLDFDGYEFSLKALQDWPE